MCVYLGVSTSELRTHRELGSVRTRPSTYSLSTKFGLKGSVTAKYAHIFLQEYVELDMQHLQLDLAVNVLAMCLEALYSYQRWLVQM